MSNTANPLLSSLKIKFNVSAPKRIMMFLCVTVLCLVIGSVIMAMTGVSTTPRIRISTIIQDIVVFILPAIATAVVITRRPAELLLLTRRPGAAITAAALIGTLVSIPAMNHLIDWNASLPLPESLRMAEDQAQQSINLLVGNGSWGSLIITLLIVGVLAGLSEELFFRGCMQRILSKSGLGTHGSIWITAILFSAVHMQFEGFVPRMLLGVWFGYLLVWSGSVWLPVMAHILNNLLAATALWLGMRDRAAGEALSNFGSDSLVLAILSLVLTIIAVITTRRNAARCDSNQVAIN